MVRRKGVEPFLAAYKTALSDRDNGGSFPNSLWSARESNPAVTLYQSLRGYKSHPSNQLRALHVCLCTSAFVDSQENLFLDLDVFSIMQ